MSESPSSLSRRTLLAGLALSPFAGAVPASAETAAARAGLISANVCMLTPETTEGPFYVDPDLVRADITAGRPGTPLVAALQVVRADCSPVEGARVDVWHCDAIGVYSGFGEGAGDIFLRGTQFTDAGGVARFHTIYPGWYRGRTTHIHYKVFLDERTVLTSQLFFEDALSDRIYREHAPYAGRGAERSVRNDRDGIARRAGEAAVARAKEVGDAFHASLVVGIAG